MSTSVRSLVITVALTCVAQLAAQTSSLTGTVVRDSAGLALTGAEVSLPSLQRSATTNYRGEFRLDRLPAGLLTVTIRRVGFAPLTDTVTLGDGKRVDREFLMQEQPAALDPVVATAPERKYVSPNLRDFEARRKQGFGHFITDEDLRKDQNRELANIIVGRVPGVQQFRVPPNKVFIGTARKCAAGASILKCKGSGTYCPVTLYIDGVLVYDATNTSLPSDVPDMSTFKPEEYAAIEFYNGGATTPLKYNASSSGCGVLLLWSRER